MKINWTTLDPVETSPGSDRTHYGHLDRLAGEDGVTPAGEFDSHLFTIEEYNAAHFDLDGILLVRSVPFNTLAEAQAAADRLLAEWCGAVGMVPAHMPPPLTRANALLAGIEYPVRFLDGLALEIRRVNEANGWNVTRSTDWEEPYKVPAVLALIGSEVSEGLEAFRVGDLRNFVEEMADVVIRTLDCVAAFEPEFDAVLHAKIEKNRGRGFKHGGKRI